MRLLVVLMILMPGLARAQTENASFNLVNRAGLPITEVYATPAGVDRWGRDRLVRSYLPAGQTFPVRLPADGNCIYDIRVVYADGKPEERRRMNVCQVDQVVFPGGRGVTAQATAPSDDPSFRLVNRSRSEVSELYVSPVGNEGWGRDRLGDETVAAGGSTVIRLPHGGCSYDVRIVFGSGESTERRKVNLCTITDLRVP